MAAPYERLNRATAAGTTKAADHLAPLTRAYARALRAAGRRAAARFRQTQPVLAAANPDPPAWVPPPTVSLINNAELADDTNRKTGKLHRLILATAATEGLAPFGISYDIRAPTSLAILEAYAARIRATIGDAIAEQVTEAIRDGYAAGSSVARVSRDIQSRVDSISKVRADMLARSDLNGISNAGSMLAAIISGAAATKTWLSAGDDRVRPDHEDADGQTVAIGDPFDVGGESAMYPGDPNLSWDLSANCRCTLTYGEPLTASAERVAEPSDFASWREYSWEGSLAGGGDDAYPLRGSGGSRVAPAANEPLLAAPVSEGSGGILYLARHGLTAYDSDDHASDTIRGWQDDPLTVEGEAEAGRLADALNGHSIGSLSSSDLQRATKTGDIVGDTIGVDNRTTDALRPWNLGDLVGQTSEDVAGEIAAYCDSPSVPVPGGESFADFCSRFLPVLADAMASAQDGATPLLVTHSHNLKLARAWIEGGRAPVDGDAFLAPSPGPASVLACVPDGDSWAVTEILCDGLPTVSSGSVPPEVHYRPSDDTERECATCDFYSAGVCTMFPGDPQVIADYVCDEWVKQEAATAITSGGTMSAIDERFVKIAPDASGFAGNSFAQFGLETLTLTERADLAARLAEPLSPSAERIARMRDNLKAAGLAGTFDDDELAVVLLAVQEMTAQPEPLAASLEDLALTAAVGGTQWQATLCVAEEPTVDGGIKRLLSRDGGSWLPLPRPLALLDDSPHADVTTKSPIVGRIDQIWWAGNVCQASGVFFDASYDVALATQASKAVALVTELRGQFGISVDLLPDLDAELMTWNGSCVMPLEPLYDTAQDPTARNSDMDYADAPGGPATEAEPMDAELDESEPIMCFTRWCIAGATICPVQALTQATISVITAGGAPQLRWLTRIDFSTPPLTASAAGLAPAYPPASWFQVDEPDEPTPLTVADDGRVYGHMALWDSCHTGFPGQCVPPPKSASDYAGFHLGEIKTAEGDRLAVGTLTMDTGHAGRLLSAEKAMAHYDNTGTAAAYVRARDGKYGIWVSGALSPRLPAEDAQAFMAAKPSGDWRAVFRGRGRDLIGVLQVNVPGFPVARALTASALLGENDAVVEYWSECESCEAGYERELAVLAASAGGVDDLAALVLG